MITLNERLNLILEAFKSSLMAKWCKNKEVIDSLINGTTINIGNITDKHLFLSDSNKRRQYLKFLISQDDYNGRFNLKAEIPDYTPLIEFSKVNDYLKHSDDSIVDDFRELLKKTAEDLGKSYDYYVEMYNHLLTNKRQIGFDKIPFTETIYNNIFSIYYTSIETLILSVYQYTKLNNIDIGDMMGVKYDRFDDFNKIENKLYDFMVFYTNIVKHPLFETYYKRCYDYRINQMLIWDNKPVNIQLSRHDYYKDEKITAGFITNENDDLVNILYKNKVIYAAKIRGVKNKTVRDVYNLVMTLPEYKLYMLEDTGEDIRRDKLQRKREENKKGAIALISAEEHLLDNIQRYYTKLNKLDKFNNKLDTLNTQITEIEVYKELLDSFVDYMYKFIEISFDDLEKYNNLKRDFSIFDFNRLEILYKLYTEKYEMCKYLVNNNKNTKKLLNYSEHIRVSGTIKEIHSAINGMHDIIDSFIKYTKSHFENK